jgi:hypothetical protein
MLLTTQKQDLLKRLKRGRVRSVANYVQVCMLQFLLCISDVSDDMPRLSRHNFILIAAFHIVIAAVIYGWCMRMRDCKLLGHSAPSIVLLCILIT